MRESGRGSDVETTAGVSGPYQAASWAVTEFIERVLDSLPRRDQRLWGSRYVKALLSVNGRKTMRTLAGERQGAVEQSFQQFISKSPWDWAPVRCALARSLHEEIEPTAWVVETETIAKAGRHSVGVAEQFVAKAGRVVNCQQAAGIWLASDRISCPVDWALALPPAWTDEPRARARADIPEGVRSSSPVQAATDAIVEAAASWGIAPRPVVMEVGEADLEPVVARLSSQGITFVLKVPDSLAVLPAGRRPVAGGGTSIQAHRLIELLDTQRQPVSWFDPVGLARRVTPVVATDVTLPAGTAAAGTDRPLVLLGAWTNPISPGPSEFWVSNVRPGPAGPVALFTMAKLARRVHGDLARIAVPLGIRDFEGRSYRGWHHHATLVSVAHAITATSATTAVTRPVRGAEHAGGGTPKSVPPPR